MDARTVLTGTGLHKTFGTSPALRGVSISISRGESVAIMGTSGSGKTTLLQILAGILTSDSGSVLLTPNPGTPPVEVTTLSAAQRTSLRRNTFGFVFQQGLLLPELTATENVAIAAMLTGTSRAAATQAALSWLHAMGLAAQAAQPVGTLSGGQAQRVAVARSQINQPVLTFADEPTGALDSYTSDLVMDTLLRVTAGAGRSLVVVTHDPAIAHRCGRVVRLEDGIFADDSSS
ncbi:ABC transporter ATP-binding protein [Gordonia sp. NPDC003376]